MIPNNTIDNSICMHFTTKVRKEQMNLQQVKYICVAYNEFRKAEKKLGEIAGMFSDATASDFLYQAEEPLIDAVTFGMTAGEQIKACEYLEHNQPGELYKMICEVNSNE